MPNITVEPTNYALIQKGIVQVAQNAMTFKMTKVGDVPTSQEITNLISTNPSGGIFPILAVSQGDLKGYATGTQDNNEEDRGARGIGVTEPIWVFTVWAIYGYSIASPNYDKAATALTTLVQIFYENPQLPFNGNPTCAFSNPMKWNLGYATLGEGQEYTVASFQVKAYEILNVTYA